MNGSRIRRLLVGFDGSVPAQRALEFSVDLAQDSDAEVTVLFVLPDASHLETDESRAQADQRARATLEERLAAHRRRAAQTNIQLREVALRGGDPAALIASYAVEHGFDLVVIGNHGLDHALHGGLGRVVERLLRDPRLPVLVVPDRELH